MPNSKDSVPIDIVLNFMSNATNAQKVAKNTEKVLEPLHEKIRLINSQLEKSPEKFTGNLTRIRTVVKSVGPALTSAKENLEDYYRTLGEGSIAFKNIDSQIDTYKTKIESLKERITELNRIKSHPPKVGSEEEINEVSKALTEVETKYKDAQNAVQHYQSAIHINKTTIGQLKDAIKNERVELEQLEYKIQSARSPKKINEYKIAQQKLTEKIAQQTQRIAELNVENNKLGGFLTGTKNKIKAYEPEVNRLNEEYNRLDKEIKYTDEEITKMDKYISESTLKIKEYEKAISSISRDPINYVKERFADQISKGPEAMAQFMQEYKDALSSINADYLEQDERLNNVLRLMGLIPEEATQAADSVGQVESNGRRTTSTLANLGKVAKQTFSSMKSTIHKVISAVKSLYNKFKSLFKHTSRGSGGLDKSFRRLSKTFIQFGLGARSLYFLVRRLRNEFISAMKEMASEFPEINAQLSQFTMSVKEFKGSFMTWIQPIASYVMPILSNLLSILTNLNYRLAEFFATLTGQHVIYKAIADNVDYADSLNDVADAADKANDKLGEYDNLLVIGQENAGSAGGGAGSNAGDLGYSFEETEIGISEFAEKVKEAWRNADFTEVGRIISEKISGTLNNIDWPTIQEKAEKIGRSIGTFITGVFENEEFTTSIGHTLAQAINTGISLLRGFNDTIDWKLIAQRINEGINRFLTETDFAGAGQEIFRLLGGALSLAVDVTGNDENWNLFAEKFCNFLEELKWGELLGNLIELGGNILKGIINACIAYIESGDLKTQLTTLGTKIGETLRDLPWKDLIGALPELADAIFSGAGAGLDSLLGTKEGTGKTIIEGAGLALLAVKILSVVKSITGSNGLLSAFKKKDSALDNQRGKVEDETEAVSNLSTGYGITAVAGIMALIGGLGTLGSKLGQSRNELDNTSEKVGALEGQFAISTASMGERAQILVGTFSLVAVGIAGLFANMQQNASNTMTSMGITIGNGLKAMAKNIGAWTVSTASSIFAWGKNTASNIYASASSWVTSTANGARGVVQNINSWIVSTVNGIISWGNGLATSVWNSMKSIVETVGNALQSAWNSVASFVMSIGGRVGSWWKDTALPALTRVGVGIGIGFVKLGELANKIQSMGGAQGFVAPAGSGALVPGFARGTVVPPNKEFLAMLGDNKRETEVVSPLSTMKQAMAEVLAEMNGTNMPEKIQIVMPNGKVLAETVWDEERKLYKQTGSYTPKYA